MTLRISVDTGGTFTDVVIASESGIMLVEKALTTPDRIFDGMKLALAAAADGLGMTLADLLSRTTLLIYGTTRATNAIVQRKTAKTALMVTKGFPDILVFREGGKFNPHEYSLDFPEPYIPRRFTFEVVERVTSEGHISMPLDVGQAIKVIKIIKAKRFEAVAISFLWSTANPANELAVAELLEKEMPSVPYTLSHKLIPIVREYRRTSATAIDASLKPLMQRHLGEMEEDLRAAGYRGEILVSTSVGGCLHVEELIDRPIHTLKSGPVMAPVAGRVYARREKLGDDVIVCDAGGTTFDVGLVRGGNLVFTRDTWLGQQWTGHIVSMSTVDVRSVGAGGGSIAWIDSGGLLRVGPHSAGAVPGPACYGRGGNEPTVTDAAVVLGYIDPKFFLGGRILLDPVAAREVVSQLARRLGYSIQEAAYGILSLVNEHMIKAIQEVTVNEGVNPRESVLVAGGGAAGLNIMPIAHELGCDTVILPKTAAALSACGMQFSDIVTEHAASQLTTSDSFDFDGVNATLQRIDDELERFRRRLEARGFGSSRVDYFVEARYMYQIWELEVKLANPRFNGDNDVRNLVDAFHAVHERVFAVKDESSAVECVNWKGRITVQLGGSGQELSTIESRESSNVPFVRRRAFFGDSFGVDTPVYRGSLLKPGVKIPGPAIIEESTTTIVVYPGMSARLSEGGSFILSCQA